MQAQQPTDEEIRKVRLWECSWNGHNFDVITTVASDGNPVSVNCNRCGKTWSIVKPRKKAGK